MRYYRIPIDIGGDCLCRDAYQSGFRMECMKLSEHFTFEELTYTTHNDMVADNRKYGMLFLDNLKSLCIDILEPIRALLGKPIIINSGFRYDLLNKTVNGSPSSDHKEGNAADIIVKGIKPSSIFIRLIDSNIKYGQLILEPTWVHISNVTDKHSRETLICLTDKAGNRIYNQTKYMEREKSNE